MIRTLTLIFFLCLITLASADSKYIFTVEDPRGDDDGDGSLIYPNRTDLKPGDLDLISFSAREDNNGTLFEANFAKPIAVPDTRVMDSGGNTLANIARFGFYTFNIDVYIDTDRKKDSGNTVALPGRMVTIAPENAWERAILVTPRPDAALTMMKNIFEDAAKAQLQKVKGRVDASDQTQIEGRVAKTINDQYFLPKNIRVRGSKISFFVPRSFLGDVAQSNWSYVIAVSATRLEDRIDLSSVGVSRSTQADLMILPVTPGPSSDSFGGGYDKDDLKPPLADIFVPKGMKQSEILKNYNVTEGRLVPLPGIVPAEMK